MRKLSKKDLKEFFNKHPRIFRGNLLLLRVVPQNQDFSRVAFIISSAVRRNAPARNLTRRRMSEITRSILPEVKKRLDLVFSYKLENKKAPSFRNLKNDILKLLSLCGAL